MKVVMKAIADVLPYGKNPRRNKKAVDAVASSIQQFGWNQPIVVDSEGVIIVGHTRYLAAQKLGLEKVPVVVAKNLTPDKVKAYRIADNKTNELAEWDVSLLSDELKELSEAGWGDFSGLAFSTMEIDALLSPLAEETKLSRPTVGSALEDEEGDEDEEYEEEEEEEEEPRRYLEEEIEQDDEPVDADAEGSIHAFNENTVFKTSNRWGVPELIPSMCWDGDIKGVYAIEGDISPARIIQWGTIGLDERMRDHVVSFYAHDNRFEAAIWSKAVTSITKFQAIKPAALVMPDFSLWTNDPPLMNLYNVYRNYWCARYWQEAGLKVLPNILILNEQARDYVTLGMPKKLKAAAIQIRTTDGSDYQKKLFLTELNWWCSQIECEKIFVYGGEHRPWIEPSLPSGPEFVWITSFHRVRKEMGKC